RPPGPNGALPVGDVGPYRLLCASPGSPSHMRRVSSSEPHGPQETVPLWPHKLAALLTGNRLSHPYLHAPRHGGSVISSEHQHHHGSALELTRDSPHPIRARAVGSDGEIVSYNPIGEIHSSSSPSPDPVEAEREETTAICGDLAGRAAIGEELAGRAAIGEELAGTAAIGAAVADGAGPKKKKVPPQPPVVHPRALELQLTGSQFAPGHDLDQDFSYDVEHVRPPSRMSGTLTPASDRKPQKPKRKPPLNGKNEVYSVTCRYWREFAY
ncbi:unnamed protein product, partial [Cyprideis torosa]